MDLLYSAVVACSFLDLLMDNTKTATPEILTHHPFLLHCLLRFPHISCVSDMIVKEFRFEFIS